ncbi:MAG: CvpA family protein [Anaerovoracaceae bacterium]|jgi:uncharacterized membrane protein required for colicin V production
MWMDIAIGLIFVISTAAGFRQGFVHTLLHTAGWILAIVLSFAWYSQAESFLRAKTNFYDSIYNKISGQIVAEGPSAANSLTADMPLILQEFIDSIKNSVAGAIASGVADFVFKILCFLLVMIIIRIVFLFLTSLFSKKHNDGLIGFLDGVLGLAAGAVKGLLLIFILLALLVPVISLTSGDGIASALETSRIAGTLYDNNYLLLIVKTRL